MKKFDYDSIIFGWTIYILECANGSYYSDMSRNLKLDLEAIENGGFWYFRKNKGLTPVKVVYKEPRVPFKEAWAKHTYLRMMTKLQRSKLIKTKKWPLGGAWKRFLLDDYQK